MVAFITDIEPPTTGMNCDASEHGRYSIGRRLDGICSGGLAVRVSEYVDDTRISARHKNAMAILANRQPIPNLGQRQELRHALGRDVEYRQPGIAEPGAGGQ